jgi:hypothetical protein
MKTLANLDDKLELLRRLDQIGPGSQRRWGKMTAPEMICHLSDAFRVTLGEREAKPVHNWFSRSLFKWAALLVPTRWPHGVSTVPECEAQRGGTPPAEMKRDMSELRELLDRFARQQWGTAVPVHPIFGPLTKREWMRWGYLHIDHHLRQFGA